MLYLNINTCGFARTIEGYAFYQEYSIFWYNKSWCPFCSTCVIPCTHKSLHQSKTQILNRNYQIKLKFLVKYKP